MARGRRGAPAVTHVGRVRVACFAMGDLGHVVRVLGVAGDLVAAGAEVVVWTDRRFADHVAAAGARLADLFAGRPLAAADDRSMPVPCRYVTFAGVHGHEVAAEARTFAPDVVVFDGFTVIGRVVAAALGRPWVVALAGHAIDPVATRAALASDPRVALDPRCLAAVERLRSEHGLADASPYIYVADPSPWLNLCGEPAAWLTEAERARMAPLACRGALTGSLATAPTARPGDGVLRVYASLGAVVWRYFGERALAILEAVSRAVARRPDARATLSLGGASPPAERVRALVHERVAVHGWVDQWAALGACDVFVTHHGLSSTHEAVARGVPMISAPIFWDQPALAARSQALGLAVPLPPTATADDVAAALDEVARRRDAMRRALATARAWEVEAARERPAIARRVLALARAREES